MATSASLNVTVKSTGTKKTKQELDALTKSGKKAEAGASDLKSGFKEFGKDAASAVAVVNGPLGGISSRITALTSILTSTSSVLGVTAAGFVTLTGAVSALTIATSAAVLEQENLARVAGMTISEFNQSSFAAELYGIDVGKLADSFKDAKERVGDFLATGGGPFQDYADVMGIGALEAERLAISLQELSGRDVLVTLVENMEKAGKTTDEMSFALEGMASDLTYVLPLLSNGGDELDRLSEKLAAVTSPLSDEDVENFRLLAENSKLAKSAMGSLLQNAVAPLAPLMAQLAGSTAEFFGSITSALQESTATKDFARSLDILFEIGELQAKIDSASSARIKNSLRARVRALQDERESLIETATQKSNAANAEIEAETKLLELKEAKRKAALAQAEADAKETEEAKKASEEAKAALVTAKENAKVAKELASAEAGAAKFTSVADEIAQDWDRRVAIAKAGTAREDEATNTQRTAELEETFNYQDELDALDTYYADAKDKATNHADILVELDTQYKTAMETLELDHQANLASIRETAAEARITQAQEEAEALHSTYSGIASSVSDSFSAIADAISSSGDDSSDAYVAAFALSKAFATAQASLNMGLALSQALALPSDVTLAQKFASYASVLSAMTGVISSISGASYSGRSQGGDTNPNGTYMVGEQGPELVTFGRDGGSVQSNSQSQQSAASTKTNYTVVNQTSGTINEVEQQNVTANDVVLILKETMPSEIGNANSGTSKALSRNTSSRRSLR